MESLRLLPALSVHVVSVPVHHDGGNSVPDHRGGDLNLDGLVLYF